MEKITAQLVDYDGAMKRLGGDRGLFRQLIQIYDEDAPELLNAIRRSVAGDDGRSLEQAAHRLKGLLANFGAEDAVAYSQQLEQIGNSRCASGARDAVTQLEGELLRLNEALDAYRP